MRHDSTSACTIYTSCGVTQDSLPTTFTSQTAPKHQLAASHCKSWQKLTQKSGQFATTPCPRVECGPYYTREGTTGRIRHNHIIPGYHTRSTELRQTHHHPQCLHAFHHTQQAHQSPIWGYFVIAGCGIELCEEGCAIGGNRLYQGEDSCSGLINLFVQSCHLSTIQDTASA